MTSKPDIVVKTTHTPDSVRIAYGTDHIDFRIQGATLPDTLHQDFAVWLVLPLAMRDGAHVHFDGTVDPSTLDNALQLADIWCMWLPEEYRPISLTAEPGAARAADTTGALHLFSGGVDSTFALLSEKESKQITHALTVHGLDYALSDTERFEKLLQRTDPLLDDQGVKRIILHTSAGRKIGKLGLTHAFILASCLFLCSDRFNRGLLSADITRAQDMMVFPWGTNHITNDYFRNDTFSMETVSLDISRLEKLRALLDHPLALASVSFCGVKSSRPLNCGVCPKCVRTKTMFLAINGEIPDLFVERAITPDQIRKLDVASHAAYKHYFHVAQVARETGNIDRIPGFEAHLARSLKARRRAAKAARLLAKIKNFGSR
jgi:hypothetical protein